MSSKKDKQKAKDNKRKVDDDIMKGVIVRKTEAASADSKKAEKAEPGKKSVKSSKFKVTKDDKTGSYCMDPVDKEKGNQIAPQYTLIWLHGHESSAAREFTKFNDYQIVPPGFFRVVIP